MERRDLGNALLCALLTLLAIALCIPIAECGFNDDWSYTKTALDLAHTGHLVYNGWAAAMLGAQAYWGALWIKLFGFSFLIVRLSTAPLAAGCAALLYALHRRSGLPPVLSVFGALVLTLSPIFIPNAASFMTEIPGQFFFLATIYAYLRAAEILDRADVRSDPAAQIAVKERLWGWLALGLVLGLVGGTVRQVIWVVPIVLPLYLLLRQGTFRRVPMVLLPLGASALIAFAGAIRLSDWFGSQPYAIQERILIGLLLVFNPAAFKHLLVHLARILVTISLGTLPALFVVPIALPRFLRGFRSPVLLLAIAAVVAALLTVVDYSLLAAVWFSPWLPNTFDVLPFMTGTAPAPVGSIPSTLPMTFWQIFGTALIVFTNSLVAIGLACRVMPRKPDNAGDKHETETSGGKPVLPMPIQLLLVYTGVYIPLLLVKSVVPESFGVFDRYLLPVFPLATLVALRFYHEVTGSQRVPLLAGIVLLPWVYYGIAQTHDHFAEMRARVQQANALQAHGIRRDQILAGFEYDGWTQIAEAGYYNDSRIEIPKGAYTPPMGQLPFETMYGLWSYTPVIRPDYVIALVRHPDLLDVDLPPVMYRCWLPPFQRGMWLQTTQSSRELQPTTP